MCLATFMSRNAWDTRQSVPRESTGNPRRFLIITPFVAAVSHPASHSRRKRPFTAAMRRGDYRTADRSRAYRALASASEGIPGSKGNSKRSLLLSRYRGITCR